MGFSNVTMWRDCSLFIRSIMAASVVDLPLPVGPVTRTRPFCFLARSATALGIRSSSRLSTFVGILLATRAIDPRW